MPPTIFLRTSIPWFGSHSGYEGLTRFVPDFTACSVVSPVNRLGDRLLGKLISIRRGYGDAPQHAVAALRRLERMLASSPRAVGHILYGEDFLRFLPPIAEEIRSRIVVTLHQPRGQWSDEQAALLTNVSNAIVLWSRDAGYFAERLQRPPQLILHGVDSKYFVPAPPPAGVPRILYSGVHLRNIPMLRAVVAGLNRRVPGLQFDVLVPPDRRAIPDLRALGALPNVTWHAGLSDEQLRSLYQRSTLLLLPMNDSGANTAIVEAMACGIPIVTTDVGGIRDYGGGAVFPVVRNDDVDGMVSLVEAYLASGTMRVNAGQECRRFAESNLAWPLIAKHHVDFYSTVLRA